MPAQLSTAGCWHSYSLDDPGSKGTFRPWVFPMGSSPLRQASPQELKHFEGQSWNRDDAKRESKILKDHFFSSAHFQI